MEPLLGASGWRQEQEFPSGTLSLAPNVGRMMDEHFPTTGTGESILLWMSLEGLRAREVFGRSWVFLFFVFFFQLSFKKNYMNIWLTQNLVCFFCITYYASPIILFIIEKRFF